MTRQGQPHEIDEFYDLLYQFARITGGPHRMSAMGRSRVPARGVYFFLDPDEPHRCSKSGRVVRVGTHAVTDGTRSSLWDRSKAHRGGKNGLGDNEKSSFRCDVGEALIKQASPPEGAWGSLNTLRIPPKEALQAQVSAYIGRMDLVLIPVDDAPGVDSDRGFIERQSIAFLSSLSRQDAGVSPKWLGNYSKPEIRQRGLWNSDHVGGEWDSRLFRTMERYVERAKQRDKTPASPAKDEPHPAQRDLTLFDDENDRD